MKKIVLTFLVLASSCNVAMAYEKGNWVIRAGVANVAPDESSTNVIVDGGDLGFGLGVDDDTQLGLNVAYFVTDRWNIEVLASTPFAHDVNVNSNPLGLNRLLTSDQLPPTITANYYFAASTSAFQPYVGVGVNYTIFFNEEFTDENEALGFSNLDLDDSLGLTAQIGLDYFVNDKWFVNASVRYIDISTDATFTLNNSALNADNAPGEVTVDVDPFVTTFSVGYKF